MRYQHTQRAPLHLILHTVAAVELVAAWVLRDEIVASQLLIIVAGLMIVVGLCCANLTVRDEGETLSVRFGPIPLFGKRLRYEDIDEVTAARSRWIDGWGIHYIPGRGWTYNLWGFDCAELRLGRRTIRIGTDDPQGLVAMMREKIAGAEK